MTITTPPEASSQTLVSLPALPDSPTWATDTQTDPEDIDGSYDVRWQWSDEIDGDFVTVEQWCKVSPTGSVQISPAFHDIGDIGRSWGAESELSSDRCEALAGFLVTAAQVIREADREALALVGAEPPPVRLDAARDLRAALDQYIRRSTPLSALDWDTFRIIARPFVEKFGESESVESVAKRLGIDLESATHADSWSMSKYYGEKMGRGCSAGPSGP